MLRIAGPAQQALQAVKAASAAVDPGIVIDLKTLSTKVRDSLQRDRLMAALAGADPQDPTAEDHPLPALTRRPRITAEKKMYSSRTEPSGYANA